MSIYFNPSFQPEYFYPLIKPLCLIYDQVVVWSPIAEHLRVYGGFPPDDFLNACQPQDGNPPIIIPVGRDRWFNRALRYEHPDEDAQEYSDFFDEGIRKISYAGNTVIPSNYENGYQILNKLLESSKERKRIYKIAQERIEPGLPEGLIVRLDQVAERQGRDRSWAIANSYIQDLDALISIKKNARQLTRSSQLRPLVIPEHLEGYLFVSPENYSEPSDKTILKELQGEIQLQEGLSDLPVDIDFHQVGDFLEEAYQVSQLPWKEVLKIRQSKGNQIRSWLQSSWVESKRRNISGVASQSICQIAKDEAFALSVISQVLTTGAIAIITGIAPNIDAKVELGTGAILTALSLTKHYTPIYKGIGGLLGGESRILIDTLYFPQTGLFGMCDVVRKIMSSLSININFDQSHSNIGVGMANRESSQIIMQNIDKSTH